MQDKGMVHAYEDCRPYDHLQEHLSQTNKQQTTNGVYKGTFYKSPEFYISTWVETCGASPKEIPRLQYMCLRLTKDFTVGFLRSRVVLLDFVLNSLDSLTVFNFKRRFLRGIRKMCPMKHLSPTTKKKPNPCNKAPP